MVLCTTQGLRLALGHLGAQSVGSEDGTSFLPAGL